MHIDKKFDKANRIVDSYMIYEKSGEVEISLSVSEVGFWLWDVSSWQNWILLAKALHILIFVFYISS